ncbi:hypothetical protein CHUAL_005235 [Chamberlinius hualienensis]
MAESCLTVKAGQTDSKSTSLLLAPVDQLSLNKNNFGDHEVCFSLYYIACACESAVLAAFELHLEYSRLQSICFNCEDSFLDINTGEFGTYIHTTIDSSYSNVWAIIEVCFQL